MVSYEDDFKSFQYLDIDINLYERLLNDLEYKNKLTKVLSLIEVLKIQDEKTYAIYNVQIRDLQQVPFKDLESFKRLQNPEPLKFVIENYNNKLQPNNLVDISQLKKK